MQTQRGGGNIFDENHRDALKVVAFLLQNYYINNIDGRGDYTFIDNNASTQSAFALLVIVLIVVAAVVILTVIKML